VKDEGEESKEKDEGEERRRNKAKDEGGERRRKKNGIRQQQKPTKYGDEKH
jgi:hypothetical protein